MIADDPPADLPTRPLAPDDDDAIAPTPTGASADSGRSLESRILLARARAKLLGDANPPTIGRYRVLSRLGAGGMGVVYAAVDDDLDRKVAIKLLREGSIPGSQGHARLRREAQALAKLSDPNVVHVYEVGNHEGQVYLAMELVDGTTLRTWQRTDPSWQRIIAMYVEAGRGLAAAHKAGIVHRDFKPDNVIVATDGRPRVLDFGLARPELGPAAIDPAESDETLAIGDAALTETGTLLGTPAYMSPEQLVGGNADARSDQFAFCVALHEALFGKRPFDGRTVAELLAAMRATHVPLPHRRGVPASVRTAITRALLTDPEARHADMDALLCALQPEPKRRWLLPVVGVAAAVGVAAVALAPRDTSIATTPSTTTSEDPSVAILEASDLPPGVPTPLPDDPFAVTVHRLANGLTLYIAPRRDAPRVEVGFVVRMGDYTTDADTPGLSHLVLHMLGSGSARIGTRDFAAEQPFIRRRAELYDALDKTTDATERASILAQIDANDRESAPLMISDEYRTVLDEVGGHISAFFQDTGTALIMTAPRPALDIVLRLESERLRHTELRGFAWETVQLVEELRGNLDGTMADAHALSQALEPATGPRSSPAEEVQYVATFPFRAAHQRYRESFVPNNTALIVVGDIDPAAFVAQAEEIFGDWVPAPIVPPVLTDEPIAGGRRELAVHGVGGPRLGLAWPLPIALRRDRRVPTMLREILLVALEREAGPLAGVHALTAEVETHALVVTAVPTTDVPLAQLEQRIAHVLEQIAEGDLDPALLEQARARGELRLAQWSVDAEKLATFIAGSFAAHRPWDTALAELVAPLSTDALADGTRALLDRGRVVVHRTPGPVETPVVPRLPIARVELEPAGTSAFVAELLARPRSKLEPQFLVRGRHFRESVHGRGKIITAPVDGPLFRAALRYPIGVADDRDVCEVMRARLRDERRRLGRQGVVLAVECGRSATTVRFEGDQRRFDAAWAGIRAVLSSGDLDAETIGRHVDVQLQERARARTDPSRLVASVLALAAWGEDGGLEHRLPTDDALRELSPASATASLRRLAALDPDVLYAGPAPSSITDALPTPGSRAPPVVQPWVAVRPATPRVIVAMQPGRSNAAVGVVFAAPEGNPPLLAELYRRWLATLVRLELRESLNVAYLVHAVLEMHTPGDDVFTITADVAHERTAEAVLAMLGLRTRTIDAAAFGVAVRATEELLRGDRTPAHEVPAFVHGWEDPAAGDPRMARWAALGDVTQDDLDAFAKAAAGSVATIVVIADPERIDVDALARLGTITRFDPDQDVRRTED